MNGYIIKICGLTDENQAIQLADTGATHIGMVHYEKSPRHVNLNKIKGISEKIKGKAYSVAVVVNPVPETVEKLLKTVDFIQFHGDEGIEFLSLFPVERVIKAFRIKDREDIKKIEPFAEKGYTLLIDAYSKNAYGGTGKQINPELADEVVKNFSRTVLSGGLSPDNVLEILQKIRPSGVDASSRLEVKPGVKDIKKATEFIKKVRGFYESDNKTA